MGLMELIALGIVAALSWRWWRRRRNRARDAAERQSEIHPSVMRHRTRPHERPPPDESALRRVTRGRGLWAGLLDRPDVLILDTETTGLGNRAEVIEVAVIDTTGADLYEAMSLPVGRVPAGAARVNGLTRRKLKAGGARPWPKVHAELAAVLSGAAVVLAWNAGFDRRLLSQTAERHGLTLPRLPWRDLIDDYRALAGEAPGKGRHTLAATVKRTGAKVSGPAHRAAADCRAVLAVMRASAGKGRKQ